MSDDFGLVKHFTHKRSAGGCKHSALLSAASRPRRASALTLQASDAGMGTESPFLAKPAAGSVRPGCCGLASTFPPAAPAKADTWTGKKHREEKPCRTPCEARGSHQHAQVLGWCNFASVQWAQHRLPLPDVLQSWRIHVDVSINSGPKTTKSSSGLSLLKKQDKPSCAKARRHVPWLGSSGQLSYLYVCAAQPEPSPQAGSRVQASR